MNVLNSFYKKFNINPATLTGAIDVIVVEQPDKTFTCSPFHVRFGKIGVLMSREKVVDIKVNGETVDIRMKLGGTGEAFFVQEIPSGELKASSMPSQETFTMTPKEESPKKPSMTEDRPAAAMVNRTQSRCEASLKDCEILRNEIDNEKSEKYEVVITADCCRARALKPFEADINSPESTSKSRISVLEIDSDIIIQDKLDGSLETLSEFLAKPGIGIIETSTDEDSPSPETTIRNKRKRKKKSLMKKNSKTNLFVKEHSCENMQKKYQKDDALDVGTNDEITTHLKNVNKEILENNEEQVIKDDFKATDFHFFSDSEVMPSSSSQDNRLLTQVKSDSEYETERHTSKLQGGEARDSKHIQSWSWGELPTSTNSEEKETSNQSWLHRCFWFLKKSHVRQSHGSIYLSDIGKFQPETANEYLPTNCSQAQDTQESSKVNVLSVESYSSQEQENGSPAVNEREDLDSDFDEPKTLSNDISMSLCGGLTTHNSPTEETFHHHIIAYNEFIANPTIVNDPNFVVRIGEKMYNWKVAGPIILSFTAFQRSLPNETIFKLCTDLTPRGANEQRRKRQGYSWFHWGSHTTPKANVTSCCKRQSCIKVPTDSCELKKGNDCTKAENEAVYEEGKTVVGPCSNLNSHFGSDNVNTSKSQHLKPCSSKTCPITDRYCKTLRLTSEQISNLNLRDGANKIEFSVTTPYQGTAKCKCFLFKWRYDDTIVVSDIDGTITKSEFFGHIMYIVGKDWSQRGVAKLFTKIKDNGYKLLYLSSRAIGQCEQTRGQLKSIKQEDLTLPEGPVLLNPTSLMSVVHTELFEKNPEKFKISCLRDILALFPSNTQPFYAGYGNKINDAWAYRDVGIPLVRVFTINHRGEIRNELSQTFQSSFSNMTQIVNQMFPVMLDREYLVHDFSQFNYWRDPIPEIDCSLI